MSLPDLRKPHWGSVLCTPVTKSRSQTKVSPSRPPRDENKNSLKSLSSISALSLYLVRHLFYLLPSRSDSPHHPRGRALALPTIRDTPRLGYPNNDMTTTQRPTRLRSCVHPLVALGTPSRSPRPPPAPSRPTLVVSRHPRPCARPRFAHPAFPLVYRPPVCVHLTREPL